MTEREKVLLRREGARRAVSRYVNSWEVEVMVEKFFPLPTITKPAEAVISGERYRYVVPEGGVGLRLEWFRSNEWVKSYLALGDCTAAELRAFADLRDHPTEEVEDEDD